MHCYRSFKHIVFILPLFFCQSIGAQSYYLNHTSEWSIYAGGADVSNTYRKNYRYYISGDTTIGAFTYYKLGRQGRDSIVPINGNPPIIVNYDEYAGAIREDNKRFNFIYKNEQTEKLLYDFKLFLSQPVTTTVANQDCNTPPLVVQQVDKVYLGTTPLNRYRLNSFSNARLIEGIGGEQDLIQQGNLCGIGFEYNSYLLCYKKDNNLITVNNIRPCGLTLAAGGPDCQAKFCYSLKDTLGGLKVVQFNSSSTSKDPIIDFNWDLGDSYNGYSQSLNHLYPVPGTYVVSLTIRTASGCTSTIVDTLKSGTNCNGILTAVDQQPAFMAEEIIIAPTLIHTSAVITLRNTKGKSSLQVYDLTGRKVKDLALQSSTTIFYTQGLAKGTYVYRVLNRDRVLKTGKIVVQ